MTRELLLAQVRRLRAGIRAHRDSTGHGASAGITRRSGFSSPSRPTHCRRFRHGRRFSGAVLQYRQSLDAQLPHAPRSDVPSQP